LQKPVEQRGSEPGSRYGPAGKAAKWEIRLDVFSASELGKLM